MWQWCAVSNAIRWQLKNYWIFRFPSELNTYAVSTVQSLTLLFEVMSLRWYSLTPRCCLCSGTVQVVIIALRVLCCSSVLWWSNGICHFNTVSSRDVNFPEFYFSIPEFQILRPSGTRKLTRHSNVVDALNAWMLRHSRHHAARLGGGPWEVKRQGKLRWKSQITKRSRLSHSSFQTRPQTAVVPCPTMNSPRVTGWALCTV